MRLDKYKYFLGGRYENLTTFSNSLDFSVFALTVHCV